MLTNADIAELTDWRRDLHRFPEVSGEEAKPPPASPPPLPAPNPIRCVTGLGGHGVAAIWNGAAPGETVLFRAELDALPIDEVGQPDWRSTIPGQGPYVRP